MIRQEEKRNAYFDKIEAPKTYSENQRLEMTICRVFENVLGGCNPRND
jgi:hypothetical protein